MLLIDDLGINPLDRIKSPLVAVLNDHVIYGVDGFLVAALGTHGLLPKLLIPLLLTQNLGLLPHQIGLLALFVE